MRLIVVFLVVVVSSSAVVVVVLLISLFCLNLHDLELWLNNAQRWLMGVLLHEESGMICLQCFGVIT